MRVTLKHKDSELRKRVKIGYSWTMLLFGGFVPLVRGDFKHVLLHLVFLLCTFGLSELIYPFYYNRSYINRLMIKGFIPATDEDKAKLQRKGFI